MAMKQAVARAWFETGVMSSSMQAADHILAAVAREAVVERPRAGTHQAIAEGLDAYHAVNLREALKLVPDTGDWHGSLRAAIEIVLREHPEASPNQTAEQMREQD